MACEHRVSGANKPSRQGELATKDGGAGFLTRPRALGVKHEKCGTEKSSKAKREQSPEVLHLSEDGGAPEVTWLPPARPAHSEQAHRWDKRDQQSRNNRDESVAAK